MDNKLKKKQQKGTQESSPDWHYIKSITNLWYDLLHTASYALVDHNKPKFYRTIDELVESLFPKELEKVEEYIDSLDMNKPKIEIYKLVKRKTIKELHKAGYLDVMHTPAKVADDEYESGAPTKSDEYGTNQAT